MAFLVAFLTLSAAIIIQSAIFSRMVLLHGTMDLVLLTALSWIMVAGSRRVAPSGVFRLMGQSSRLGQAAATGLVALSGSAFTWALMAGLLAAYVSATPDWAPITAYLGIAAVGVFIRRRVWQVPLLGLLAATVAGSLILNIVSLVALRIAGVPIDLLQAANLIILPSTLLNLLGAIPINGLVGEIANFVLPSEEEEL